jgi:hypothetical protein
MMPDHSLAILIDRGRAPIHDIASRQRDDTFRRRCAIARQTSSVPQYETDYGINPAVLNSER